MAEDTRTGRAIDNPRTCVHPTGTSLVPTSRALGPRESFLVAYDRLAMLASIARGPSVVVAVVDPRAQVIASLCLEDRGALVIGRHTCCGLRLPAETASLRHAAALVRFEEGRPVVRLWDLRTGAPFVTEDQERAGAVIAEGPLYAAIEGYAIWFIPAGVAWRGGADAAWRALPARSFLDRRPPDMRPLVDPPLLLPGLSPGEPLSRITRVLPPLMMGEGPEPEIGWGEIRLSWPARRERRAVSAERLEQGILVGRYERCGVIVGDDRISRVHVLLVRIGAEVWAIDTASTNGVRRDDVPLAAGVLRDADTLSLGSEVTLDWRRAAHPEA